MVDIKRVLHENNIYFVEQGPNTKKGEISIGCPQCGDDPSQHLGIDPKTGWWACWRDKKHRGKNIARLLRLLGIPYLDEKPDILKRLLDRTFFNEEATAKVEKIRMKITSFPDEFMNLAEDGSIFDKPYLNYLKNRGFDKPHAVAQYYKLMRSLGADKWSARLIIPIFVDDEVSWTARSIGVNPLRYLSPLDTEARNIKETLFNYNELKQSSGDALLITEGPIDALKIDWYNKSSIRATCLFGMVASDFQLELLKEICPNYNNLLIGLDQGTLPQSLELARSLKEFGPIIVNLPKKDFGEMTADEIKKVLDKYL